MSTIAKLLLATFVAAVVVRAVARLGDVLDDDLWLAPDE
jgi:hypothetical protein